MTSTAIPTGDRAARKRAAIIRAARREFLRRGFGAGMDQIAAKAGVSKVTVYNHFNSKEDLFTEVVGQALSEAFDNAAELIAERLDGGGDTRELLVALARGWVEGIGRPDVLALRALIAAESQRFPALGRAWREQGPDRFASPLAEILTEDRDLGIPNLDLAVTQLYSLVLYPHIVHSAYGQRLDPAFTDELITSGVDMFLGHYARRAV